MENVQTTDVKMDLSRQANTETHDGDDAWTYDNGSHSSKVNPNEPIGSSESILENSPEFRANEHLVDLALKTDTSLLQFVCLGNGCILIPVHLQVGETGLHAFIAPPASSTISRPLVMEQQSFQHLNSQLPASLHSCPFPNAQANISPENSLLNQPQLATMRPEASVHNTDSSTFQSSGIITDLQDLIPVLRNYVSSRHQMTGPDQPVPLAPNFLPHVPPQPQSMGSPVTSLLPPATLLVPYPVVVPLPVPLPIPIPIQIPQSPVYTTTSRTGSMIHKTTQTSTTDLPTISCCAKNLNYPILQQTLQDEALDLSTKTTQTQTRPEHQLSASANSALDLSVPVKCLRRLKPNDTKGQAAHRQNTPNKWSKDEGNRNITHSKFEAYNRRIVSSSQTVKAIVSATKTVPANQRGFSRVSVINSSLEPDNSYNTVPHQSFEKP